MDVHFYLHKLIILRILFSLKSKVKLVIFACCSVRSYRNSLESFSNLLYLSYFSKRYQSFTKILKFYNLTINFLLKLIIKIVEKKFNLSHLQVLL
ncbi:unnamed protein product [Moneuplotes crassus]|uniref:Uncharacterized protein n=1 Tax=Euplotes crassus TaxID=5936 RepID=A0AAD1XK71_EUPCR|nr:unnamed protein product [Moneuplotes crassus]